jgi:hypothetical protein
VVFGEQLGQVLTAQEKQRKKPMMSGIAKCQSYRRARCRESIRPSKRRGGANKEVKRSNLGISSRWIRYDSAEELEKHMRAARRGASTVPISVRIASNLRGEVSRRGEPLAVEPRHGE